jgi:hypothetical protein
MRNTTKFVSQFLELKWIHNIFPKYFSFQKKMRNEICFFFFCLTAREPQWPTAENGFGSPRGGNERPGSVARPTGAAAQGKQRGGSGARAPRRCPRRHCGAVPAGSQANSGRAGTGERAHKTCEKMANTRVQRAGVKRGRERRRGEMRARWPEMVARQDAHNGALSEAEVERRGAFGGEEEMAERDARAIARRNLAGGGTWRWSKRQRRRACERTGGMLRSLCG